MGNDNSKIMTFSFLIAGALVWLVVGLLLDTFAGSWGFVARAVSSDLVRHGVPVLCGFGTFSILQFNSKILNFSEEVVEEIKKVVWPSRKDTVAMTIVVCVMLLISGLVIGTFDVVSAYVINLIIK